MRDTIFITYSMLQIYMYIQTNSDITTYSRRLSFATFVYSFLYFIFLENVFNGFRKCEWCAAFLDCCASDKRNNQIQNKIS